MNRIVKAREIAERAHAGIKRKYEDRPYIEHPHDVVKKILATEEFKTILTPEQFTTMVCAGWLHDVIEDCPEDQRDKFAGYIEADCGPDVLRLVYELTNPSQLLAKKPTRTARKVMDRVHLSTVSWMAKAIKLIDRWCNLSDMLRTINSVQFDFVRLYANESTQLLEVLKDTNKELEDELEYIINVLLDNASVSH